MGNTLQRVSAGRRLAAGSFLTALQKPKASGTERFPLRRILLLLSVTELLLLQIAFAATGNAADSAGPAGSNIGQVHILAGDDGRRLDRDALFAAMESADIVVIGEVHTDAKAHVLQREIIVEAARRWRGLTVSVEEFDRSQQSALLAYLAGDIDGAELQALRKFVDPVVKKNWSSWYLPKLQAAKDGGAELLASNAPLKYSRLVRNVGCENLPAMEVAERSLFECPAVPEDPEYKQRFASTMKAVARRNNNALLKPLQSEQLNRMFRAHRVWDATMAQSIAQTAADSAAGDAARVLHLVGSFHVDFYGGLIQELRHRARNSQILVISLRPGKSDQLLNRDRGRADIVIYTG